MLALLMVTFSLTACGNDKKPADNNNNATSQTDGNGTDSIIGDNETGNSSTDNNVTDNGVTDNNITGNGSTSAPTNDAVTGDGATSGTNATAQARRAYSNGTVTRQNSLVRGATYEQMLRNARVHDADGNLRDYENAVTPGTAY